MRIFCQFLVHECMTYLYGFLVHKLTSHNYKIININALFMPVGRPHRGVKTDPPSESSTVLLI